MSARILAAAALLSACGTSAPQEPFPLVTPHASTAILKNPKLVTITYADYEFRQQVEDLGDFLVGSSWLRMVVGEYGVGPGTHVLLPLTDPAPATLSDSEIITTIRNLIGTGQAPPPDDNTLYMVYVSALSAAVDFAGKPACVEAGGYHGSTDITTQTGQAFVNYAVVYDCSGLDGVTTAASHELIEAALDPHIDSYYASFGPDMAIEENADLCEDFPSVTQGGYQVTRAWSNAAALSGKNPCVPAPDGEIYYGVYTTSPREQTVSNGGATFELTGWSQGAMDQWVITPIPDEFNLAQVAMSLDVSRIGDGGHATLKLTPVGNFQSPGLVAVVHIYSGPNQERDYPVAIKLE
jgi:hypothetical protein